MVLFMIVGITNYAIIYSLNGITDGAVNEFGKPIVINDIVDCLYFSMVTWTTLGYGDLQPISSTRFVAASEALMGYFSVGLIVGAYFEVISNLHSKK